MNRLWGRGSPRTYARLGYDEDWTDEGELDKQSMDGVPLGDGSNVPLGDIVPESHWVLSAG